ncbi:ABC transporter ATP-binding protein [Frigoribacterium faeni]|uniref:ABC transporter ATP-binding protein n=1 Tax=Frigoribacterium faeni TaxID=145483 RepID=UPI001FAE0447|nr:ABC transporter ATP-binding protein [Frigoribacterium faeni]MCJ0702281.1 ABC transporter ATP-binding protein [Frigoribacterium faeni]
MHEPILDVREARRSFRTSAGSIEAVRGVDLSIGAGEVVAVLGPNGAGKTTTVKMAATLLEPTRGSVRVAGIDAVADPRAARRHLGLVLGGDRGFYMRASAFENLRFFGELQGVHGRALRQRIVEVLARVGLSDRRGSRVETYSRGMRQRLHLARALLAEPELILLDEPSIGLDPEGAEDLRGLIRELRASGKAVLLTTHDLADADDLADRIVIISDGLVVAEGAPSDIAARAGIGTVTTLTVESRADPRPMFRSVAGTADIISEERRGLWYVDLVWEHGRDPAAPALLASLADVRASVTRPTTLEEAYLAFLRTHRERVGTSAP